MPGKIYYIIVGVYFIIGALGTIWANRGKEPDVKKQRWLKYLSYLVIVNAIISILIFKPELFRYFVLLIIAIGFFEILKVGIGKLKTGLLWFSIHIYCIVSFLFALFAFSSSPAEILFVYIIVLSFDGFSQIFGQLIGKRQLSPGISPNKTVEGFVGGLAAGIVTAQLIRGSINASWVHALLLSFLLCLSCLLGDLTASWYKRKAGVKDYSSLIPGHGGVLDRFDSLIAAGAVYFVVLQMVALIK